MSDRFIKIIFLLFAAAVPFMDVAAQRFDIDVLFEALITGVHLAKTCDTNYPVIPHFYSYFKNFDGV